MMSEQSYKILKYLQEHNGASAIEVAEAVGMEKRRVDACFSATIIGGGLGVRDTTTTPSSLRLNEEGLNYKKD
jgi:hypothetical protein